MSLAVDRREVRPKKRAQSTIEAVRQLGNKDIEIEPFIDEDVFALSKNLFMQLGIH